MAALGPRLWFSLRVEVITVGLVYTPVLDEVVRAYCSPTSPKMPNLCVMDDWTPKDPDIA